MVTETLAELAGTLEGVKVDGERASALDPRQSANTGSSYMTSARIAREAGISLDSPRYSGMHNHCQYMRTC